MKLSRLFFEDGIRYCLSGAGAAAADFLSYLLLCYVINMPAHYANLISRPIGGIVSFLLHKYCTFQNRGNAHTATQVIRFLSVWAISFSVSQGLVWICAVHFNINAAISKVIAESMAGIVSFLCLRHWTFKKH